MTDISPEAVERLICSGPHAGKIGKFAATLRAIAARVAELEARGCARGQGTTQFCAEAVSIARERDAAMAEAARLRDLFRRVAPVVNAATWTKSTRNLADELHALIRAALAKEDGQ